MEIAHSIDLHDVDEGRHHKQVTEEPHDVVPNVSKEVKRPHNDWNQKDCHHDYTTEHQDREMLLLWLASLPHGGSIDIIVHLVGEESSLNQI